LVRALIITYYRPQQQSQSNARGGRVERTSSVHLSDCKLINISQSVFIPLIYLLRRRSWQQERLYALVLSICSLVCLSVAKTRVDKTAIFSTTKQFTAVVSIADQ